MKVSPRRTLKQAGFTLVELITVILVIGILAAVAIPRYLDIQKNAREAKVDAVAGSIRAAAAMVKAKALVDLENCAGKNKTVSSTAWGAGNLSKVQVENDEYVAIAYCYPVREDVAMSARIDSTEWDINPDSQNARLVTFELKSASNKANCVVTYEEPGTSNKLPTITVPTTNDCS